MYHDNINNIAPCLNLVQQPSSQEQNTNIYKKQRQYDSSLK